MANIKDKRTYFLCSKCMSWIPYYAVDIHSYQCHEQCMTHFTHPFIKDYVIYASAHVIQQVSTSITEQVKSGRTGYRNSSEENIKPKKKHGHAQRPRKDHSSSCHTVETECLKEPDWLKKVAGGLLYRLAVFAESDFIRCKMCAYSPCLIYSRNEVSVLLAVPDKDIPIGTVLLYEKGISSFLPSASSGDLLKIKSLGDVRMASKIQFSSCDKICGHAVNRLKGSVKKSCLYHFPLGSPFCFNIGSKFMTSLEDGEEKTLTVSSVEVHVEQSLKHDEKFIKEDSHCDSLISLSKDFSELQISSEDLHYITVDECKHSDLEDSEFCSEIVTSAPKTPNVFKTGLQNLVLLKQSFSGIVENGSSSIFGNLLPYWVRIGKDTEIIIECNLDSLTTVKTPGGQNNRELFRSDVYTRVKTIFKSLLQQHSTLADKSLCYVGCGILLYGPPGTGKTELVKEISREMSLPIISLTLSDLAVSSNSEEECITEKFHKAVDFSPSVLLMDEIDSLCPAFNEKIYDNNSAVLPVVQNVKNIQRTGRPVLIVATSSRPEGINFRLRQPGRFDWEVPVPLPLPNERLGILQKLTHNSNLPLNELEHIAVKAHGFSGADMDLLLKNAWVHRVENWVTQDLDCDFHLAYEDLKFGLNRVVPTVLKESYTTTSKITWNDIWGYESIKSRLKKMLENYKAGPQAFPLRGLLLYGPPGCSKTMFAQAVIQETGFSFFPVKCSELLSKYVGETEKSLSRIFSQAEQAAPSLIFMDEVDSLCGSRGGLNGSGLVSEFLSLITGSQLKGSILVVAATNRPQALDEALLRPGCLELIIYVSLPDCESRCAIWSGLLKDIPVVHEINIQTLCKATDGYSGAEIVSVYQTAAQTLIQNLCNTRKSDELYAVSSSRNSDGILISESLLLETITQSPPRTPMSLITAIEQFSNQRHCSPAI